MKCPKCGADLPEGSAFCTECGAKINTLKSKLIVISITVGVIIAILVTILVIHNNNVEKAAIAEREKAENAEKARQDSIQRAELAAEQLRLEEERKRIEEMKKEESTKQQPRTNTTSSHKLDYGTWVGGWKNGQPNGNGRMTFSTSRIIDNRDKKKRTASVGDYVIGEYSEGKLVQGVWYDSSNNVKGSILIGL